MIPTDLWSVYYSQRERGWGEFYIPQGIFTRLFFLSINHTFPLSFSFPLWLSTPVSLPHTLPRSYLYPSDCLHLSFSNIISRSFSFPSDCLHLSLSHTLSIAHSLSPSDCLHLSLSHTLYIAPSLSPSDCLPPTHSPPLLFLHVIVSFPIWLSPPVSLPHTPSLILFPPLAVSTCLFPHARPRSFSFPPDCLYLSLPHTLPWSFFISSVYITILLSSTSLFSIYMCYVIFLIFAFSKGYFWVCRSNCY